jgi:hypothetical protein
VLRATVDEQLAGGRKGWWASTVRRRWEVGEVHEANHDGQRGTDARACEKAQSGQLSGFTRDTQAALICRCDKACLC